MSIQPGFTNDEIRDFVYQYERLPHGSKLEWLREQGISKNRFSKWRVC